MFPVVFRIFAYVVQNTSLSCSNISCLVYRVVLCCLEYFPVLYCVVPNVVWFRKYLIFLKLFCRVVYILSDVVNNVLLYFSVLFRMFSSLLGISPCVAQNIILCCSEFFSCCSLKKT